MRGRKILLLALALLVGAAPCLADETSAPPAVHWRSTCVGGPTFALNLGVNSSREELVADRKLIVDFVASTNSYLVCLYTALAALKADFAKSGRTVNPVVDDAVAQAANETTITKVSLVTSFNTVADYYDSKLSKGVGDTVELIDISLLPPPLDSRVVLPPDAGPLSMPLRAVGSAHDCGAFFPSWVRIHHRGGSTLVGYDVAADGSIANAQVLTSSDTPEIDEAAVKCVTTLWRYTPAIRDGVPLATTGFKVLISFFTSHRVGY